MSTNTEIKDQINTGIRTKTEERSIKKGAVSDILDNMVDYTDQEVQSAKEYANELLGDIDLSSKADIDSPSFQGTPTAPTAPQGTNTQQLATTAFVAAAVASPTGLPLQWSARVFQSGTNNPVPQSPQVNTITTGVVTPGGTYRQVVVERADVGIYYFGLRWENYSISGNKCALYATGFGGNVNVIVGGQATGTNSGYNYTRWGVETRNSEGVLTDGLLNGNTGYFQLVIYP